MAGARRCSSDVVVLDGDDTTRDPAILLFETAETSFKVLSIVEFNADADRRAFGADALASCVDRRFDIAKCRIVATDNGPYLALNTRPARVGRV